MRHHFRFALVSALLGAAAVATYSSFVEAKDSVLAATLNPSDTDDEVSVPAYVPIQNLSAFLTAAWKRTESKPPLAADVQIAAKATSGALSLPAVETVFTVKPVAAQAASSPVAAVPAIATVKASEPLLNVTPVSAQTDESAEKASEIAPAGTSGTIHELEPAKDAVGSVPPAAVRAAISAPTEKATPARSSSRRLASLSKPASKKLGKGAVYRDWQVGVQGQSMEPLISSCAQAPRKCSATIEFCGC